MKIDISNLILLLGIHTIINEFKNINNDASNLGLTNTKIFIRFQNLGTVIKFNINYFYCDSNKI